MYAYMHYLLYTVYKWQPHRKYKANFSRTSHIAVWEQDFNRSYFILCYTLTDSIIGTSSYHYMYIINFPLASVATESPLSHLYPCHVTGLQHTCAWLLKF